MEGEAEIEHLFKLMMINYPFVLLEDVKGIQANAVAVDNLQTIKNAVKYLIDGGHKKNVHFAGPPRSTYTREHIEGFRDAFSKSPLIFNREMIISIGSRFEESYGNTKSYFANKRPEDLPIAIICFKDQQAVSVMTVLRELSIRVPEDISIIGNDDIHYARLYPVPLTTIRVPQREIGIKAAEILINNIEPSDLFSPEHAVLHTDFIIRESSKTLI